MVPVDSQIARLAAPRVRWGWWLASRGAVVLIALAMMAHRDWKHVFDDLLVYSRWGDMLADGHVPAGDPMWQYPPLAGFVFAGIGFLGSQPWMFLVLFAAVDLAISVLLARDGLRRGRWHGFAVWLAAPLLLGPIMYGRYDVIPTLTAMAGLTVAGPVLAGAVLALGGGLKVWPAVMALALARRDWARGAVAAAAASVAMLATAVLAFPSIISGFLGNGEARGLQTESVAALPFVWARMVMGRAGIPEAFRYGSSEVAVPAADALAKGLLPLTALGLLVLVIARAKGRLDHAPPVDIAFVAILWMTVTSRVLSPQYNVWLVGMAALVWAAGSERMRRATLPLAISALAAQMLYPFAYVDIIDGAWFGVFLQTVRIGTLLLSTWLAIAALLPRQAPAGTELSGAELSGAELSGGERGESSHAEGRRDAGAATWSP